MWSLGASIDFKGRKDFDKVLREIVEVIRFCHTHLLNAHRTSLMLKLKLPFLERGQVAPFYLKVNKGLYIIQYTNTLLDPGRVLST